MLLKVIRNHITIEKQSKVCHNIQLKKREISVTKYRYDIGINKYPNGTINKKTIQNNINFSVKLIDAIASERFDLERITYDIIKNEKTITVVV